MSEDAQTGRGPRRRRGPGRLATAPPPGQEAHALDCGGGGGRGGWRGWPSGRRWPGRSWCLVICAGPGCRPYHARVGVHGCFRADAPAAARRWPCPFRPRADAGHCLCGQRVVGVGSAGRAGAGHGVHVPPHHPAGRRCPAGWLVAAGRRVVSTVAGALVVAGGGLASGNVLAAAVAVPGGVLAAAFWSVRRGRAAAGAAGGAGAARRWAVPRGSPGARPWPIPARSSGSRPGGWVSCSFPWRAGRW